VQTLSFSEKYNCQYIIIFIIIIDILILIRTVRNLNEFFISHYSVNILFAGLKCKRNFQYLKDI